MPAAWIGAGAAVLGAVSGASGSSGASSAANAADPFASQRGQYQQQLSALIADPSSITSTPGYQFGLTQSNNAVEGSAAANGMVNSGNVLQALSTNSQGYAATALNNQELLLAQLSGANVGSPGTAGQILQGQNQTNQSNLGAGISSIGTAAGNLASGFSSGSVTNPFSSGASSTDSGSASYGSPSDLISGYTG